MQLGSGDYQLEDSFFMVIHPFTYVVIGIALLIVILTFILLKKRKKN